MPGTVEVAKTTWAGRVLQVYSRLVERTTAGRAHLEESPKVVTATRVVRMSVVMWHGASLSIAARLLISGQECEAQTNVLAGQSYTSTLTSLCRA